MTADAPSPADPGPTAAMITIGDEILSGRTQDRNIAQIGAWLNLQGIRLNEVRVVPGTTCGTNASSTSAAARPARRMPSKPSGP